MDAGVKNIRYDALDGVRAFSAIGIVVMHVFANGRYNLQGFVFERLIPSFTNLVFLFMIISAFSMCCGYYEKICENKILLESFYKKRFVKILPFFGILSLAEIAISPSQEAMLDLFANLTLCFGFLPNAGNISVIGVGWFLGVVFVFYIIFPFYCCLLRTKRRAWSVLLLAYLFNVLCADYFEIERTNILYDAVYFVCGGLIYLYRSNLSEFSKRHRALTGGAVVLSAVMYYAVGQYVLVTLCLCSSILVYAMGVHRKGVLWNRYTKFLGTVSMEVYLGHMVCFRIIERIGLLRCFESDLASFALATVLTLVGAISLAVVSQWGLMKVGSVMRKVHAKYIEEKWGFTIWQKN